MRRSAPTSNGDAGKLDGTILPDGATKMMSRGHVNSCGICHNTPYRDGGWTVRQVAHHVPDSHMNAYIRFRLALTEQEPTIKPYEEARWAELEDAKHAAPDVSLALLDSLHERWARLLRSLKAEDFPRTFRHPDHGVRTLDWMLFLYAWHGRHHTAHVTELRKQKGW